MASQPSLIDKPHGPTRDPTLKIHHWRVTSGFHMGVWVSPLMCVHTCACISWGGSCSSSSWLLITRTHKRHTPEGTSWDRIVTLDCNKPCWVQAPSVPHLRGLASQKPASTLYAIAALFMSSLICKFLPIDWLAQHGSTDS